MTDHRCDAAPELCGRCEWCGIVSHHLVGGQCPRCASKAREGTEMIASLDLTGECEIVPAASLGEGGE